MIPNDTVQASIISKLKNNSTITAALVGYGSDANQVKEAQWQGSDFLYPAVRVLIGTQTNDRASPYCSFGFLPFTISVLSQKKSSQEADDLLGTINNQLHGSYATGVGMQLQHIECIGLTGAIRVSEQLWRSEASYFSLLTTH